MKLEEAAHQFFLKIAIRLPISKLEALESVIKIRLKRRIAKRSGKGNQQLNIKTSVERPILINYLILGGAFILFYFPLHPSFLDVFL